MSLSRRLEKLESRAPAGFGRGMSVRGFERYFHLVENARRELHGLETLPELPYTEEDYHDDLGTLEHTIPTMRAESGWQGEQERAFLDQWERDTRERMER